MPRHFVVLAGLVAITAAVASPTGHDGYRIARIEAHLYYQSTGTFGAADIIADSSFALWNTIIGAGDARTPSGAILVLVGVSGSWLSTASRLRVQLAVQVEGGRTLLRQTVDPAPLYSETATIKVPFIVFGTGCGRTIVTAALVDARGAVQSSLRRTIPFECGE